MDAARNSALAELDETIAQLTTGVAAHEARRKQARHRDDGLERLETVPRDGDIERVVRMSRAMELERNGNKVILVPANSDIDNERLV